MARKNSSQDGMMDQPSEDIIDLADGTSSVPPADEFVEVGKSGSALMSGGILGMMTGLPFLLGGMVIAMIAMIWLLVVNAQRSERESKYIEQSSQLLMLSQRLAKDAREAVVGQPTAFKTLKDSRDVPGGGVRCTVSASFEIEGQKKPAAFGDMLLVYYGAGALASVED